MAKSRRERIERSLYSKVYFVSSSRTACNTFTPCLTRSHSGPSLASSPRSIRVTVSDNLRQSSLLAASSSALLIVVIKSVHTFETISGRTSADEGRDELVGDSAVERYLTSMSRDVGGSPVGESDSDAVRFGVDRLVATAFDDSSSGPPSIDSIVFEGNGRVRSRSNEERTMEADQGGGKAREIVSKASNTEVGSSSLPPR